MFDANLWYQFLPKLLNMSLTASVVILCVLLARLCLRRQPRILSYALWAVVLFRLLCPVSVSSDFSVFGLFDSPVTEVGTVTTVLEYVPKNLVHTAYPAVSLPVVGDRVNTAINDALPAGAEQLAADPLEAPVSIVTIVWGMGVLGMLLYSGISLYSLRRRLVGSTPLEGRVLLCDHIDSPFVLGLIRPRIYLPSGLSESERGYILLHERTHIRRGDHIVKLLAFAALTVHWFNPLVWAAFVLLGQDMEMSCDEAVIRSLGDGVRADYSQSLLRLATGQRLIAGTPLAFGEGDTKGRIRNILRGRRTRWWLVSAGVLLVCTVIAVCVFNPSSPTDPAQITGAYDASTLSGDFLRAGNPAYTVGSNAYGRPVFVDAGAAFDAFTEEYADAVAYIREANSLAPLTRRNYDMYKVLGFQTTSDDETLAARCREVSQFLDLYENSFIAEGSVSAATPTRPAAGGIYAGDAFLAQHGGLSFEPPDGKFFAEILIKGNLLEVADREGNLLFSGENVGRQSVSREELIDRMSGMYLYAPGVGQLDQKALEDFVPHYDGLDMEICTWYSTGSTSGDIAYIIYCFEGIPTWFVTGENLRFHSMIPAPTASDLTEASPETSASQSQPPQTAASLYRANVWLFQNRELVFRPVSGSHYAEIRLDGDRLTVAYNDGSIVCNTRNCQKQALSRNELVNHLSAMNLSHWNGLVDTQYLQENVPSSDTTDPEICRWYDESGEALFCIYFFNGEPTWFVQGNDLRFFSLVPLTSAANFTDVSSDFQVTAHDPIPEYVIETLVWDRFAPDQPDGLIHSVSYMLLDVAESLSHGSKEHILTYYLLVSHNSYSTYEGKLTEVGGSSMIPTALRMMTEGAHDYRLIEYWEPYEGSDVRDVFPERIVEEVLRLQGDSSVRSEENYNKALAMLEGSASYLTEPTPDTSESQSVATQPAVADPSVDPTIDGLIIPEHQIDTAILRRYAPATPDGRLHVESHMILDARERRHPITGSREITYYLLVSHNSYSTYGGELTEVGGSSMIPTALRFEVDNANSFTLIEYWEPRDGAGFDDDVRDVFPEDAAEDALHLQGEGAILSSENYNKALLMLVSSATIDVEIADRLNTICSYPTASSNPGAYIDAHPEEYELLLGYGEYTLRYCFSQFLPGGQTGLRGHIMASLMQDIMERWGEEVPLAWKCPVGEEWASDPSRLTAQGWFDDFLHQSLTLRDQLSAEEFEKHHPVKAMLLEMTDNT